MKRLLIGLLLAVALVVSVGPAGATGTTTSCGMAYIPPFHVFYKDQTYNCFFYTEIANITDDVVHVKVTLYYDTGNIETTWEADIAPHATYFKTYNGSVHPCEPYPRYYGTIEWTAQFCTQKALIASAMIQEYVHPTNYNYMARSMRNIVINGGLPF